jgi:hypothetical protein
MSTVCQKRLKCARRSRISQFKWIPLTLTSDRLLMMAASELRMFTIPRLSSITNMMATSNPLETSILCPPVRNDPLYLLSTKANRNLELNIDA